MRAPSPAPALSKDIVLEELVRLLLRAVFDRAR